MKIQSWSSTGILDLLEANFHYFLDKAIQENRSGVRDSIGVLIDKEITEYQEEVREEICEVVDEIKENLKIELDRNGVSL